MGNPASKSSWEISSVTQGNKKLRRVESSKVTADGKLEAVTAQGEDDPIGTVFSPGAINISFNVFIEEGDPEVDWLALWDSKERISLTRSIGKGRRYQYNNVQVSKDPDVDGDNQGKHTYAVELIATSRKRLPNA